MSTLRLPDPDQASQPQEFLVSVVLGPAELVPGSLLVAVADADGRGTLALVSDPEPGPLPPADRGWIEPFAVAAAETGGRLGLIVCRDGLPGVTSADRAWAEVLRDRCALGGLECLGVLVHTPDGVVRAG
jgi:hypothetical protein